MKGWGWRAIATALGAFLVLGSSAAAQVTLIVSPGDSIQEAVDEAPPGAVIQIRPGLYAQSVVIKTDRLTLRGFGIDRTIIDGSGIPAANGITIEDAAQVTIENLMVRNFAADGIAVGTAERPGSGGSGHLLQQLQVVGSGAHGYAIYRAQNVTINDCAALQNDVGFLVADSPECQCTLVASAASDNRTAGVIVRRAGGVRIVEVVATGADVGVLVREAGAHVYVEATRVDANSEGIVVAATDGVQIYRNSIMANNKEPGDKGRWAAGHGIALLRASRSRIVANAISAHETAGIRIADRSPWGDQGSSDDNLLCPNTFDENQTDVIDSLAGRRNRPHCVALPLCGEP